MVVVTDEGRLLGEWVTEARQRSLDLVSDLDDGQLMGPRLSIVNPLLWEIGHLAWFQEWWVLRHGLGRPPLRADADALWDSSAVAHDTRWDLPLPARSETVGYMHEVRDHVLALLGRGDLSPELLYLVRYTVFHEDMHGEAFMYTRQTLAYPPPPLSGARAPGSVAAAIAEGDCQLPGGHFRLGAERSESFVFDNEKWAHDVELAPFAIARRAVTQAEFAAFVEDGGYARADLWSEGGRAWLAAAAPCAPLYWRRAGVGWERRHFDRWVPLEPDLPVIHVNAWEAEAWCRWAKRRLPTEAEWEAAASLNGPDAGPAAKRRFPWGDAPPDPQLANLDGERAGCVAAAALPAGDSAAGCRQMIGNVWEWTSTPFAPYPGFQPDMYRDYSQPWFHTHRVLRGGCWATRGRLLRNTWRNYYTPDRRDVWAGFRTCVV